MKKNVICYLSQTDFSTVEISIFLNEILEVLIWSERKEVINGMGLSQIFGGLPLLQDKDLVHFLQDDLADTSQLLYLHGVADSDGDPILCNLSDRTNVV